MFNIIGHQINANQNHSELPLTPTRAVIASAGEDVERLEPSHTVDENAKWCSRFGKWSGRYYSVVYYLIPFTEMCKIGTSIQRDIQ